MAQRGTPTATVRPHQPRYLNSTLRLTVSCTGTWRFDDFRMASNDLSSTTTYTYDDANELLTMATGGVYTEFTYDDWGRTESKSMGGHLATYQYRYGDKLKSVTTDFPDEATVAYDYDGLGKRRNRTNGNGLRWWRWDVGWNPIAEYDDSDTDWDLEGLAKTYIPNPRGHGILAGIAGSDPGTGTYGYLLHDHLGSVRRIRDANKTSVGTYEYDPYGGQYAFSGLALNHGFTGHIWERNCALYFAPYRMYAPGLGRWLTRDPLFMEREASSRGYDPGRTQIPASLHAIVQGRPAAAFDPLGHTNPYLYAGGNPICFVDPDGRFICWCGIGLGAVVLVMLYCYGTPYIEGNDPDPCGCMGSMAPSGRAAWWGSEGADFLLISLVVLTLLCPRRSRQRRHVHVSPKDSSSTAKD